MKIHQEAWQLGNEQGYDDGFNEKPIKTTFYFPEHYSEKEKEFFVNGYNEGYSQGKDDL